jgi:hypothetical protein
VRRQELSTLDWILSVTLMMFYIFFLFTVCWLTFKKGHVLLGILGIFLPFLWLIGAILPAKRGSRADIEEGMRRQAYMDQITS